ncbi:hybrid sensor histidine kinase/response regulator [Luteimonas abyssi]|uniref:hybrid sensor histidine kinase/response regulator n=1 Tax=Luteimonas abyssi TaxID=1247514 RepID=UPI000737BED3|nr:hybrid sensor histidine kinase/response regulator [Luteimonas abyssi]
MVTKVAAGRILVVDDQPANLRVVSALLSRNGYEVLNAGDGEEALRVATASLPDLILLDVLMPGMDGFAVLAEIKQREALMRLPVVCLTAARDREQLLHAFDAGAVDYVTKPFLPEELLARVSAHVGLKLTRDRLERVARERQELVNLVAHDLKNPLSSVLFASDILRNNGVGEERVPRYLETIYDSANDALGYIKRYLETQRSRREDTERNATTSLQETVEWLENRYGLQFEARGRAMRINTNGTECGRVAIDPLVLRQVAENLVTNAMKYAPDSDVDVACRPGSPGYWQLVVEDRGPGIPNSRQRELFKPFVRMHEGVNPASDVNSTGLGLSLAKQIVTNVGGQLWYEDREGGGSRFVVELTEARGR